MTRKLVGATPVAMGLLLLGMAIVGHFTPLGDYRDSEAREWGGFDADLAAEVRSWSALSAEAERRVAETGGA